VRCRFDLLPEHGVNRAQREGAYDGSLPDRSDYRLRNDAMQGKHGSLLW
jgi:hypothetical protein